MLPVGIIVIDHLEFVVRLKCLPLRERHLILQDASLCTVLPGQHALPPRVTLEANNRSWWKQIFALYVCQINGPLFLDFLYQFLSPIQFPLTQGTDRIHLPFSSVEVFCTPVQIMQYSRPIYTMPAHGMLQH